MLALQLQFWPTYSFKEGYHKSAFTVIFFLDLTMSFSKNVMCTHDVLI